MAIAISVSGRLELLGSSWRDRLVDHVIAACSILVAYLLTAATLLPVIEDMPIIKKLRAWGYYRFILRYIGRAAWSAGVLLLLSMAVDPIASMWPAGGKFDRLFSTLWWGSLAFTIGAVYVATRILLKMLQTSE